MKCGHDNCPNRTCMRLLKNVFIVFFILALHTDAAAQTTLKAEKGKQISVKHANSLKGSIHGYQRLIGAVEFEQQGMIMTCDSAHFFNETNSLDAYGHVHIRQGDSLNIYGDQLKYDGNARKAELTKNVRMIDADMTLTTEAIVYDLNEKVASYSSGGKIINKENVLTSQIGAYSTESKTLSFKKNVVLINPQYVMKCDTLLYHPVTKTSYFLGPTTIKATNNSNFIYCENGFYDSEHDVCQFQKNAYIITKDQTLKGDSIWYNRKLGLGKAMKNVQILDTTQKITIKGDLAIHNENTNISLITGNALYIQAFTEDSLFLHADTLKSITIYDSTEVNSKKKKKDLSDTIVKEPQRIVLGYHNVRFYKTDLQGKCDSLAWTSVDSTMRLYNDPVLWSGGNQLTAEKVSIITHHGEILQLNMDNNAFIASSEDSTRFNQIKGKKMTGYFVKNELYKIYVEGNGQTLYYAKDNGAIMGVNRADCSSLVIKIANQDVQSITFYNHPEATLYPPLDLPPKEALLKDFRWRAAEQPLSVKDLFLK
jgi:lipopolysaccharide export system protein LptA